MSQAVNEESKPAEEVKLELGQTTPEGEAEGEAKPAEEVKPEGETKPAEETKPDADAAVPLESHLEPFDPDKEEMPPPPPRKKRR